MAQIIPPPVPKTEEEEEQPRRPVRIADRRNVWQDHGNDLQDWEEFTKREHQRFLENEL